MRVVLVGIDPTDGKGFNQSEELVLDADQLVALGKSQLTPMFALRSPAAAPAIGMAADQQDTSAFTNGPSTRAAAAAFTRDWLDAAIDSELADLHARRPRIPRPLDLDSSPPSSRPSAGRCLTTTRRAVLHGRRSGV